MHGPYGSYKSRASTGKPRAVKRDGAGDTDSPYKTKIDAKETKKKYSFDNVKPLSEQSPAEKSICPRCGSGLVQRQGPYSSFLGCSRYPECTFTRTLARNNI